MKALHCLWHYWLRSLVEEAPEPLLGDPGRERIALGVRRPRPDLDSMQMSKRAIAVPGENPFGNLCGSSTRGLEEQQNGACAEIATIRAESEPRGLQRATHPPGRIDEMGSLVRQGRFQSFTLSMPDRQSPRPKEWRL